MVSGTRRDITVPQPRFDIDGDGIPDDGMDGASLESRTGSVIVEELGAPTSALTVAETSVAAPSGCNYCYDGFLRGR